MQAVRIELDPVPQRADPPEEVRQFLIEARLAAGDGDAVEKPGTLCEKRKELRIVHDRRGFSFREFIVMAERAAPVAAVEKHGARDVPRIIQKGHFLQTSDLHNDLLLLLLLHTITGSPPQRPSGSVRRGSSCVKLPQGRACSGGSRP